MIETLRVGLEGLGIRYDERMAAKLIAYMERVLEWNGRVNMTAITDRGDFIVKHFLDSLVCHGWDEVARAERVIDVGTGAGFPGVPLAILFPEKKFTLVDSLGKRVRIIQDLLGELEVGNVEAVHGRAEDLGNTKGYRERFALCLSRAVADLKILAEYCLPFVAVGGHFLAYKGGSPREELEQAQNAIKKMGGKFLESREITLDGGRISRSILVIAKRSRTPKGFPRKAGTPERSPIV
ncbi:MAG: 16S rRNA (guanine(527)-N(7))-methyltransferase RsmG [Clostridiales Family XIII bacterium]|jgi:16S rRNA (guanine527-N7)-methyltransferase|nr:16S rRNA (guanine(527)-N(7))-methyltransferase RsmG [Clostridiales Family XIII bacterium]